MGTARTLFNALFTTAMFAAAAAEAEPTLTGVWSATAQVKGADIPFRLALAQTGETVRASFFDGARRTNPSAPAHLLGGKLHLVFPSYAAALDLVVTPTALDGTYTRNHTQTPIHAVRQTAPPAARGPIPAIAGEWIVPKSSDKGEKAWRLILRQTGATAQAAILRVDGDTGTLDGRYEDGAFRLSHFAGERPARLEIRPAQDGRLALKLDDGDGHAELTALRPSEARAQGLAPADPTQFTGVKDPSAPFRFAFSDLDGHRVASTDTRFRRKVVLVDVMGSWCPNCHDEAPFLQQLYQKHRAEGLEVVALDFEQPDQLADPQRLKAFVARYHLTYPVLLAGDKAQVQQALPQAQNLVAWPTTFFVGRDGRVKLVHVGFTSPGSGARDVQTKAEVEREVRTLLAQKG
jgi:thiol-disulfide isomerase/thioredoxin